MKSISKSAYQDWLQAYVEEDNPDPHGRFAELQGIDRQGAKELNYKIIYSSQLPKLIGTK